MSAAAHRLDSVALESEIPETNAEKRGTERALKASLVGLPGLWSARILCSRKDTWWMVLVLGPRFRWAGFFRGSSEQNADTVTRRVTRAIQEARLLD